MGNDKAVYPNVKALVVDDIESNLYIVKKTIASYGLAIDTAMSGSEAVDKIKNGSVYDIVFMDHLMPEMDGIETTKAIREMGKNMPVIALTANEEEGAREMFLAGGLNDLLTKPINRAALEKVLAEWLPAEKPGSPFEIPPELPLIFEKLKAAFAKNDFAAIDDGMESLDALNPGGALKEEIDKINEAVLTIDYNGALEVMGKILA